MHIPTKTSLANFDTENIIATVSAGNCSAEIIKRMIYPNHNQQ